jgi:hypothetical protein
VKIDVTAMGTNIRFMITNRKGSAKDLVKWYDQRGEAENRIKELKLGMYADRLSCHRFRANAVRLQLHTIATLLMTYFRRSVLGDTALAQASPDSIRIRLLKVGARVVRTARQIHFHIALPIGQVRNCFNTVSKSWRQRAPPNLIAPIPVVVFTGPTCVETLLHWAHVHDSSCSD